MTTKTKNILLDVTGTDQRAVNVAANILCTAMAEAGATIESVEINGVATPSLAPTERTVSVRECCELVGLELTAPQMAALLEKMRFGAQPVGNDRVKVQVPCFRADIMHDWDLFEDVAIAYGYENFDVQIPPTFSIGKEHGANTVASQARTILSGIGYLEMMPFTLTNERVLSDYLRRPRSPHVLHLMHPISEEYTVVRTDILPLLLEMLQVNRHRELPQRIFATGDVVADLQTTAAACSGKHPPGSGFLGSLRPCGCGAPGTWHQLHGGRIKGRRVYRWQESRYYRLTGKKSACSARFIPPCLPRLNWNTRSLRSSSIS